jgi:hypothetical protein
MTVKKNNKHKELIMYLHRMSMHLKENNPVEDNEIILLNVIRQLSQEGTELDLAIARERFNHAAMITERDANPKWNNPFIHWTGYKAWAVKTQKLLKLNK